MICETCKKEHNGSYASGRFCDSKCAKSFSTKTARTEINKKVSKTMSGRKPAPSSIGRSGNRYSKEACQKGAVARVTKVREGWISKPFSEISGKGMRFRILHEQNNQCSECGIGKTWNNKPLTLQLDHIDGDRKNNTRENLRMICPNCHTQTHTYGSKNVKDRSKLATYGNRDCD